LIVRTFVSRIVSLLDQILTEVMMDQHQSFSEAQVQLHLALDIDLCWLFLIRFSAANPFRNLIDLFFMLQRHDSISPLFS
jgi:hypothetical protein